MADATQTQTTSEEQLGLAGLDVAVMRSGRGEVLVSLEGGDVPPDSRWALYWPPERPVSADRLPDDAIWVGRVLGPERRTWALPAAARETPGSLVLFALNRGFIIMPWENMLLTSPFNTKEDNDSFVEMFDECIGNMLGG